MALKDFSVDAKLGNDGVMYLEEQKTHVDGVKHVQVLHQPVWGLGCTFKARSIQKLVISAARWLVDFNNIQKQTAP